MEKINVFACPTAEEFTKEICDCLKIEPGKIHFQKFANDNNFVQILESVRGQDVYVVQTTKPPVNERIMEMLIAVDALKRAFAGRITIVLLCQLWVGPCQTHTIFVSAALNPALL